MRLKGKNALLLNWITCFFLLSCHSSKNLLIEGEEFNIDDHAEYFSLTDTVSLTIIDYIEGCACGTISCASNCIGITDKNDTIRVLSLCNTDTYFKKGMQVRVTPAKKPNYQVKVGIYYIDGKISPLHRGKLKTTYGTIIR